VGENLCQPAVLGGLFLDPGDLCRCVGGVNVEHAQHSEHERRWPRRAL